MGTGITLLSYDLSNSPRPTGADYLQSCDSFGEIGLTNFSGAFQNTYNLTTVPTSLPLNSTVTNTSRMFWGDSLFNQDISNWDVSNVTDMSYMFYSATIFNQDISNWDVSNVTDMSFIFSKAYAFNKDISNWNTQNVTNMAGMFYIADTFNNGDMPLTESENKWTTINVTNMSDMFSSARLFNEDISTWNTSKVTNMSGMFNSAGALHPNNLVAKLYTTTSSYKGNNKY